MSIQIKAIITCDGEDRFDCCETLEPIGIDKIFDAVAKTEWCFLDDNESEKLYCLRCQQIDAIGHPNV